MHVHCTVLEVMQHSILYGCAECSCQSCRRYVAIAVPCTFVQMCHTAIGLRLLLLSHGICVTNMRESRRQQNSAEACTYACMFYICYYMHQRRSMYSAEMCAHTCRYIVIFCVRLCPALVASTMRAMPQKAHCKEDGLQETDGRANADVRHRTGIFYQQC